MKRLGSKNRFYVWSPSKNVYRYDVGEIAFKFQNGLLKIKTEVVFDKGTSEIELSAQRREVEAGVRKSEDRSTELPASAVFSLSEVPIEEIKLGLIKLSAKSDAALTFCKDYDNFEVELDIRAIFKDSFCCKGTITIDLSGGQNIIIHFRFYLPTHDITDG